jgi:hypothetical protein
MEKHKVPDVEETAPCITFFVPMGYDVRLKSITVEEFLKNEKVGEPKVGESLEGTHQPLSMKEKEQFEQRLRTRYFGLLNYALKVLQNKTVLDLGRDFAKIRGINCKKVKIEDDCFIITDKKGRRLFASFFDVLTILKSGAVKKGKIDWKSVKKHDVFPEDYVVVAKLKKNLTMVPVKKEAHVQK